MAEMKTAVVILSFCLAQGGVLMAPIRVSGTEGGRVEFKCSYPDTHIYTPKYFCRHPCGSGDVLISTEKTDYVSKGRYSALDDLNAKTFSVIIRHLQLRDTGVYYCGLGQWGRDTLTKVELTVREAQTPPSTSKSSTHLQETTTQPSTVSPPATPKAPTHLQETTTQPSTDSVIGGIRFGVILVLLLCGTIALLWAKFVYKPVTPSLGPHGVSRTPPSSPQAESPDHSL